MYVRFVVGGHAESHRLLTGVITEARFLRERGELAPHEDLLLEEAYEWLNSNIPVPPFESSNWPEDAVSWFRDDAAEPIRRVWEIVYLLKEHGVPVRMLRSENPGKIL